MLTFFGGLQPGISYQRILRKLPSKKGGHIYGKNEGWAYLRKLLYMLSLSFCGCGYHFHPDHHQFNGSGRKVGNKKLCTSRLIIDCGLFPEGARRPRILHLQRQISSSSSLLVYILLLPILVSVIISLIGYKEQTSISSLKVVPKTSPKFVPIMYDQWGTLLFVCANFFTQQSMMTS